MKSPFSLNRIAGAFGIAFMLGLFVLVPVSHAQTASTTTGTSLQTQIASLRAQIAALEKLLHMQMGSTTPEDMMGTSTPGDGKYGSEGMHLGQMMKACNTPPSVSRNLREGSSGSDVGEVQKFLQDQGDYNGPVTSFFGPMTRAALAEWQDKNGVASSTNPSTGAGSLGPRTRSAMIFACRSMNMLPPFGNHEGSTTASTTWTKMPWMMGSTTPMMWWTHNATTTPPWMTGSTTMMYGGPGRGNDR